MCPRDVITVITWVSLVKPVETKLVERNSRRKIQSFSVIYCERYKKQIHLCHCFF